MTASDERALRELKREAEATLFAGWDVTPELKADLWRRIGRGGSDRRPVTRPWVWGSVAAVFLVAMLTFVGGGMERAVVPAPSSQATVPPPVPMAQAPAENKDVIKVTDAYGNSLGKVTVFEQSGTTVTNGSYSTIQAVTLKSEALSAAPGAAAVPGSPTIAGAEAQPGRKIIMNAEYVLKVQDARTAMSDLQQRAVAAGGYVVEANVSRGEDGSWAGRLVLRVPAVGYNAMIPQVRQTGEIKQERQWSQDVTDRYMDLEIRSRILTEQEQKLEALALKAATFDDWLKLTKQINENRAQIESMQGSLKQLANQVDYATLNIALLQAAPAAGPAPDDGASGLWPAMRRSFHQSLGAIGATGQRFLVGLAAALPFLVGVSMLTGAGVLWIRRRRRRNVAETEGPLV